ncbi:unnamed protein product [Pleuronectes platessa]|uniref:Uncharacterized protein n=1 Tax=Pleuronectes platessa TaxID=8262 RepID=A0A9N7YEM9_PLEPL|nr:unnamed protein product [Pleuronectes platessa]
MKQIERKGRGGRGEKEVMKRVCQVVGAPSACCVPIVAVPGSGVCSECGVQVLPSAHSSDQGIDEANLKLLTTPRTNIAYRKNHGSVSRRLTNYPPPGPRLPEGIGLA